MNISTSSEGGEGGIRIGFCMVPCKRGLSHIAMHRNVQLSLCHTDLWQRPQKHETRQNMFDSENFREAWPIKSIRCFTSIFECRLSSENLFTRFINTTFWLIKVFIIARKIDMVVSPDDNILTDCRTGPNEACCTPELQYLETPDSLVHYTLIANGSQCYGWVDSWLYGTLFQACDWWKAANYGTIGKMPKTAWLYWWYCSNKGSFQKTIKKEIISGTYHHLPFKYFINLCLIYKYFQKYHRSRQWLTSKSPSMNRLTMPWLGLVQFLPAICSRIARSCQFLIEGEGFIFEAALLIKCCLSWERMTGRTT